MALGLHQYLEVRVCENYRAQLPPSDAASSSLSDLQVVQLQYMHIANADAPLPLTHTHFQVTCILALPFLILITA